MARRQGYSADARRKLDRLTALRIDRPKLVEFATELVAGEKDRFVLQAALAALDGEVLPSQRARLIARYQELAAAGAKGDPGCGLRVALLRLLRPLLREDDIPLIEGALNTYEVLPQPGAGESAQALRAEALLAMSDRDPTRAAFHAVRLLVEHDIDRYSGEPATTAARLLAAMDTPLALYLALLKRLTRPAEVTVEALKGLESMPGAELERVFEMYGENEDSFVVVGAIDLALAHAACPETARFLQRKLRSGQADVYNYAVTAMVASHRADLLEMVLGTVDAEHDVMKLAMLGEALKLGDTEPQVKEAIKAVREKLAARERR